MLGSFNFNSWYFFIRQYIRNTQLRIADETSLTRWHFAIVIIEKGKRFYTLSSCRVIIKSWIILQFTVLVELINVSSCSPFTEWSLSLSLSLSLSSSIATALSGEFEREIKNSSRVDYYWQNRGLQKWSSNAPF